MNKNNELLTNKQIFLIKEMEQYAKDNDVPILKEETLDLIKNIIVEKKLYNILEIGTAIAYSSINFCFIDKSISVDTIERNEMMYRKSLENVEKANLKNRINVFFEDAITLDVNKLKKKYDFIFIDAAKAQYIKFFEKYSQLLKKGGIVISDNLLFHGLIENATGKESRNLKQLLRKIRNYNDWLKSNQNYDSVFLRIGDGIAISTKK